MRKLSTAELIWKINKREPMIIYISNEDFGTFTYDQEKKGYVGFGYITLETIKRVIELNEDWIEFYE